MCLDYVYAPWREKPNYFGDDKPAQPVYIDDDGYNNNADGVELQTTQPDAMPVTPISPGVTADGFGRVASASPRSPVPDGDYGTVPMAQISINDNNDEIDEMDGQVTGDPGSGGYEEPVVPGGDEYPVLPSEQQQMQMDGGGQPMDDGGQPMQMDGGYNDAPPQYNENPNGNWMDPNNYQDNNDGGYTVPEVNNENGYAD